MLLRSNLLKEDGDYTINLSQSIMQQYQREFIDFLVQSSVLTFGDFTTKSGRKTPYFVNTGRFDSGSKISKLGQYYATHIVEAGLSSVDSVFGPAYKGIPLAVSTASALYLQHDLDVGYTFDRKERKEHGDGGLLVGHSLKARDKVVLVEDVITAGTTLRQIVPFLRETLKVEVVGVVIAVDRCERGQGKESALTEAEKELAIKVWPIVNVHQIIEYLSTENQSSIVLSKTQKEAMLSYLAQYGA